MKNMNAHSILWQAVERQVKILRTAGVPEGTLLVRQAELPDVEPVSLFPPLSDDRLPVWFWQDAETAVLALGALGWLEVDGPERFRRLAAWHESLCRACGGELPPDVPLLVGGFAFLPDRPGGIWQGWPSLAFFLPALIVLRQSGVVRLILLGRAGHPFPWENPVRPAPRRRWLPPTEPDDFTTWRHHVLRALSAIEQGELEKVVLSRLVTVPHPRGDDEVLRTLVEAEHGTIRFAFGRQDTTFLGATPELLLSRRGERLTVACLAGSRARGREPREDARLAEELLASEKDRREHRHVVEAVLSVLVELGLTVDAPPPPSIRTTPHVQHLFTPLTARGTVPLAELLSRLHPTPAVGGVPREAALRFLAELEGQRRGYYTGAVGYLTCQGDAHFAVALRAALMTEAASYAFAGCGIVRGSTPEEEYQETLWKLEPLLKALDAEVSV